VVSGGILFQTKWQCKTMDLRLYQLRTQPLEQMLPRLLEKLYSAGDRVLVLVSSAERAAVLDRQLWTFSTASFLPHTLIDDPMAAEASIWLATQLPNTDVSSPASSPLSTSKAANLLVLADGQELSQQLDAVRAAGFDQVVIIFDHDQADQLDQQTSAYGKLGLNPKIFVQQLNSTWVEGANPAAVNETVG
jgi:DNA polymerase-3 subunit chi